MIVRRPRQPKVQQRMMLYCHDGMGMGHLRRGLAICDLVADRFPSASMLLVTGTPHWPVLRFPDGVDCIKLPSIEKVGNGEYCAKSLHLKTRRLMECRKALLLSAVRSFEPSVFIVDKAPLGVCREMVPTLRWMQRNCPNTRVVFGMRDIEDTAETTIRQWHSNNVPEILDEFFDQIWVYGSESICDVVREYKLGDRVARKLRYIGYVKRPMCAHAGRQDAKAKGRVLVTVGGGTDGADLLRRYCGGPAQAVAESGKESILVAGPDLPDHDRHEIRQEAERAPATTLVDQTSCMPCEMNKADLVVSMGGYNTMCEVASFGKSALIIPRVTPRQEQAIRATRWAQLGLVDVMHPLSVTPERFTDRVLRRLAEPIVPDVSKLDMTALDRIGDWFAQTWDREETDAASVRV